MAHPKHRISKMKRRMRRSHHALVAPRLMECNNCGGEHLPHRVCPACGHYRGAKRVAGAEE